MMEKCKISCDIGLETECIDEYDLKDTIGWMRRFKAKIISIKF